MKDYLDIEKSINNERLTFKKSFRVFANRLWNSIFGYMSLVAAFVLPTYGLISEIRKDNISGPLIIFTLLMWTMGSWVVYGLLNINRLKKIKGTSVEDNKNIISEVLRDYFNDFSFYLDSDRLIGRRGWTRTQNGKELIVLFKGNDVYINIKTLLRFGTTESQFHVIGNQSDIKQIVKRFNKRIKAPHNPVFQ